MTRMKQRPTKKTPKRKPDRVAIGVDVSMSAIAVAGIGVGRTTGKRGPAFAGVRWSKETDYFERLRIAAKGHDFVLDAIGKLGISPELDYIAIAVEEPWPMGMLGKGKFSSSFAKQQAQIQGAFLGSLVRYKFVNVYEINTTWWRQIVADGLGITIHYSKYGSGLEAKMRSKEWAHQEFPEMEEFPDLIQHTKLGLIPRPDGSKARAVQCDDRYDSLAMALWCWREMRRGGVF